jgi:hypothetical protein
VILLSSSGKSRLEVLLEGDDLQRPERLHLTLTGPASAIPPIKNSKVMGRFLSSKVKARIKELDLLWFDAMRPMPFFPRYEGMPLFVGVLIGRAGGRADADNILAAVKDWMEPAQKVKGRGKPRGWGIGLVDDDKSITGFAAHSRAIGGEWECTQVVVRPLEIVRASLAHVWAEMFIR